MFRCNMLSVTCTTRTVLLGSSCSMPIITNSHLFCYVARFIGDLSSFLSRPIVFYVQNSSRVYFFRDSGFRIPGQKHITPKRLRAVCFISGVNTRSLDSTVTCTMTLTCSWVQSRPAKMYLVHS